MANSEYGFTTTTSTTTDYGNPITWFVTVRAFLRSLFDIIATYFGWRPSALEHLQLDAVAVSLGADPGGRNRRSRSFRMRALLHDLFAGFGFVEPQAVASA